VYFVVRLDFFIEHGRATFTLKASGQSDIPMTNGLDDPTDQPFSLVQPDINQFLTGRWF